MFVTRFHFVAALAACALLLLLAPSVVVADGEVAGTIRIDGKPLAGGKIAFHQDNGQFVGSKVKDGKYNVDRAPAGILRVTLEGKAIPLKYASEDTSGLVVEVVEGRPNRFDFDLIASTPN